MPIFDYRCTDCSNTYDVFHKVREVAGDIVCPSCGSTNYKKLMSIPSIGVSSGSSPDISGRSCEMGDECCGGVCGVN